MLDQTVATPMAELPAIPRLDVGAGGPVALVEADPDRLGLIMSAGLAHYGPGALRLGDRVSRRWLEKCANPYRDEVAAIAAHADGPGAYLLNLSYEWTCTTATGADPSGVGNRLLRTLDWPLDGLGRHVVVARMTGAAGDYENVTWPGFSGIATAMAPGRFAAAINQPPMRKWTPSCWLDWSINRARMLARRALPPVHLLRRAFDTCRSYPEAKALLIETPIAMPAFFTLSGVAAGEGCVIERREDKAAVREAPASVANHWIADAVPGRYRGVDSPGRFALMERLRDGAADDFAWVQPPILNATTRLSVIANAATGKLVVQGWEEGGPATGIYRAGA